MTRRVAVLGAGPVGLDAALAFTDAGWDVTVYEADAVGAHVRAWGHVRLFTPWSMALSPRMGDRVRVPAGDACPTGHELVDRVLAPLAGLLGEAVQTGVRVLGVARRGLLKHEAIGGPARAAAPFRLLLASPSGDEWSADADLVLDCTGTYATPNALGDGGVAAPGERALGDRIVRHLPDLATDDGWAGRRILLVGAGKSAQTAARDLAALAGTSPGTEVVWAVRDPAPDWGAIPDDTLPGRRELVDVATRLRAGSVPGVAVRTGTHVTGLRPDGEHVVASLAADGAVGDVTVDRVLALTGYVGDADLHRQLQVHECYATAAPMGLSAALLAASGDGPADCLAQPAQGVDVLRSPEPDFFVLGAKSYGRNNAFLLRVGYQQVDEVVGAYAAPLVPS